MSQQRIRSTIIALVLVPALAITALSAVPSRAAAQGGTLRSMWRDILRATSV